MLEKVSIKHLKDPIVLLALGLGSGLVPKAPGTAGTLMAVPLFLLMQQLSFFMYAVITAAIVVAGIWISSYTVRKLGVHDHPSIVIDEIAGFLITMFAAPAGWIWIFAGFVLFRIFDILKPWPISWLDKHVHGGLGVMLDDVVAGLMSLMCIHVIFYVLIFIF